MGGLAFIASLEGDEIVDHHISIITTAFLVWYVLNSGRCWESAGVENSDFPFQAAASAGGSF